MSKKELELSLEDCNVYVNLDDYESWEALQEDVQDNNMCNEDVIYYAVAIDYLKENDQSLSESIEIALEYGYELENINSELLASLLKSRDNEERFYSLEDDITEYYESLKEDEDVHS